jgi:small subunit ribosomal protein S11
MAKTKAKKKQKKSVAVGVANIKTTFNNTIVTISDILGNTVCWASSGSSGFKGARKNTPFAAQSAARNAGLKALDLGMEKIEVVIKGRGNGRETSVRALKSTGLNILSIEDRTSVPHNGCRPPKKRRL